MTDSIAVYRSADMNAETDASAIHNLLADAGLHPELLSDSAPGVVAGSWEVRVPPNEAAEAEELIAEVPQDDPGAADPTHELDLVTVMTTEGANGEVEALAVKSMLDSNGIPAVIVGAAALPNLGFELRVAKENAPLALQAIEDAKAAGPSGAAEAEAAGEMPQ